MGALLEGEGHVTILEPKEMQTNIAPTCHAVVTNTDPEIISACLRVTGAGHVLPHTGGVSNLLYGRETKQAYRWMLQAWSEAVGFLQRVEPYSMKAQKALDRLGMLIFGAPAVATRSQRRR